MHWRRGGCERKQDLGAFEKSGTSLETIFLEWHCADLGFSLEALVKALSTHLWASAGGCGHTAYSQESYCYLFLLPRGSASTVPSCSL